MGNKVAKLLSDKKYAEQGENYGSDPVNYFELAARKLAVMAQPIQLLTHINDQPSTGIILQIPELTDLFTRNKLAKALNKPYFAYDGTVQVQCATVNHISQQIIIFVSYIDNEQKNQLKTQIFPGIFYMQLINDMVAQIIAKYTCMRIPEASQYSVSLLGSIAAFDGTFIGLKQYQFVYDLNQTLTILYFDPQRYDNKNTPMKLLLLLTNNNTSRLLCYGGYPVICVVLTQCVIQKQEVLSQLLLWERCSAFAVDNPDYHQNDVTFEQTNMSDAIFKDASKYIKIPANLYIVMKRSQEYLVDPMQDIKKAISNNIKIFNTIQTQIPAAPQDLINVSVQVDNAINYDSMKVIEQILLEHGSYQINIDFSRGIVSFLNTPKSINVILQNIKLSGFGCKIIERQDNPFTEKNSLKQVSSSDTYQLMWTIRALISFPLSIIWFILQLVIRESPVFVYIHCFLSLLMILFNYPILQQGLMVSVKQKTLMPEFENSLALIFSFINQVITVICIIMQKSHQYSQNLARFDISSGTIMICGVISLSRYIEVISKKRAVKNFNGLAENLPEDVYIIQNLDLKKIVKFYHDDNETINCDFKEYQQADSSRQDIDDIQQLIQELNPDRIFNVIKLKRASLNEYQSMEDIELALQHQPQTIKLAQLQPGKVVIVYRGDIIPCDGYILSGFSPIDESFISKQSQGISKGPGDKVYAGTKVLSDDLFICACAVGNDTLIGHLTGSVLRSTLATNLQVQERDDLNPHQPLDMLHDKQQRQSILNRLNSVMRWFRLVVLLLSVVCTIVWISLIAVDKYSTFSIFIGNIYGIQMDVLLQDKIHIIGKIIFINSLFCSILFFCFPFAYYLSTPISSLIGNYMFGKAGLIIRDCTKICEKIGHIKIIAFPLVGGLTYGKPVVNQFSLLVNVQDFIQVLQTFDLLSKDCNNNIMFNGKYFDTIDTFFDYVLRNTDELNILFNDDQLRLHLTNKAIDYLRFASSLMMASQNAILAGILTSIKVLTDKKYTKYVSRRSSIQKFNIPSVQDFFFDPQNDRYSGIILNNGITTKISVDNSPEIAVGQDVLVINFDLELSQTDIQISFSSSKSVNPNKDYDFHIFMNNTNVLNFQIKDQLRSDAVFVVDKLKKAGYKVCITSTEPKQACLAAAKQVGIIESHIYCNIPFEMKPTLLAKLQQDKGDVFFICDGVNDLKCVPSVSVSIALSDGRDGIKAATDVVSVKSQLTDILETLSIARQVQQGIMHASVVAMILEMLMLPFVCGITLLSSTLYIPQYTTVIFLSIVIIIVAIVFLDHQFTILLPKRKSFTNYKQITQQYELPVIANSSLELGQVESVQ